MLPGSSLATLRAASPALLETKLVVSASASECSWKSLRSPPARTPRVSGLYSLGMVLVDPGKAGSELVAGKARICSLAGAPARLDAVEILLGHVAGHVHAVEARAVEALDRGIQASHVVDERVEVLVDHRVGADQGGDLVLGASRRDQLAARGHVDAVHVREAHRRRGGGEEHLACAALPRHLHDLAAGG